MNNPFLIEKSFRIRHKILEYLHNDWKANGNDYDRRIGSIKVASDTNISIVEIHNWHYLLVDKGEIVVSDNDGQIMMSLSPSGTTAFIDKKYIKEGKKEKWDNIFAWARILIPLSALILSIVNYISNHSLSDKIESIQTEINKLKKNK